LIGDTSCRLKLRRPGEGQTSRSELIFGVIEKNEDRPELLLHINPADWSMRGYRRCSE
jgi:hypothetical protein